MRLDKFLCEMGLGSRSQVKQMIKKGWISVDGRTALRPEEKVGEDSRVLAQGREILYQKLEYYMLNKPSGCVSATSDSRCTTVLDLISEKKRKDLFPVGRLDKDTEGLLLITNDGELAHFLLSPKRHVDKTYYARIQGCVREEHISLFQKGLSIGEEKPTLPAVLEIQKSADQSEVLVTIREGRFHQIKRMFEAIGCQVIYLKRLSMGSLTLDPRLEPGEYRALKEEEIWKLKEETGC